MQWYEYLIIIAAVAFVAGVIISSLIRKKKGKGGCDGCGSCDCCGGCSMCSQDKRQDKKSR